MYISVNNVRFSCSASLSSSAVKSIKNKKEDADDGRESLAKHG